MCPLRSSEPTLLKVCRPKGIGASAGFAANQKSVDPASCGRPVAKACSGQDSDPSRTPSGSGIMAASERKLAGDRAQNGRGRVRSGAGRRCSDSANSACDMYLMIRQRRMACRARVAHSTRSGRHHRRSSSPARRLCARCAPWAASVPEERQRKRWSRRPPLPVPRRVRPQRAHRILIRALSL